MFCWKLAISYLFFKEFAVVPKIRNVKPLKNFELLIEFENEERKLYDMKPMIKKKEKFKPLKSVYKLWDKVEVDMWGFGIRWNDDIDLFGDELYINGKNI